MTYEPVCEPPKTRKQIFKEWVTVPLIGGIILAAIFDFNNIYNADVIGFLESVTISFTFWSVLANGNSWITVFIDRRWSWLETPIKRVVMGIGAMYIFTTLASSVILYIFIELYFGVSIVNLIESEGVWSLLAMPLGITTVIALWLHGQSFLMEWRQSAIDVERLKTESMESKFESLRSQVNPHFLFNSLNALSSLVYSDQAKAVDFIQKLSQVYRYVLEHQNDEVVDLASEVEFLKSFVYLNKIRFGNNFEVSYTNLDDTNGWTVPPVALQMLVENCIKHNEVSNENPLKISISKKEDLMVVENNLNPINVPKQDSNGLGLSNIISRYELLSDKKVEVSQTENSFRVSVPLLKF